MDKIILEERLKNGQNLKAHVVYDRGGWKMWSGIPAKRGYYLVVEPTAFSASSLLRIGARKLITEASAFSAQIFDDLTFPRLRPLIRSTIKELQTN